MFARDLSIFALGSACHRSPRVAPSTTSADAGVPILSGWPRVVVVGAGFGGLRVARGLAGVAADVLVLDRHNYHCFQPLLYQVATAALEPEEIAHPVRQILRGLPNVRFRLANVESMDLADGQLTTDVGVVPFDYLVIATGSSTNFFGNGQLAEKALGLKGINEAVGVRNHLLECFERAVAETDREPPRGIAHLRRRRRGPTGVEFSGALAELIRLVLVHDYPGLDVRESRVILVEGRPFAAAQRWYRRCNRPARQALLHKGVDVRPDAAVKSFDSHVGRAWKRRHRSCGDVALGCGGSRSGCRHHASHYRPSGPVG